MTEIIDGKIQYNELTKNANGGTELMARLMVDYIPEHYLKGVQIIHSRVRELQPNMKHILVCHDLPNDPEVKNLTDIEYRNQFEKIVFVSNWQQHMYNLILDVPFRRSVVISNGIKIPNKLNKSSSGPIKLIYHTTPHRGLELLLPAFKELSKHFDVQLDIFSSFSAYGWGERDEQYKYIFDEISQMKLDGYNIYNHGFQNNDIIRDYLSQADIFAYPSIWPETSCISLIEAMCHGCFCVHSNLGALPETSKGLTNMYMYSEDRNEHVNLFYEKLFSVVSGISSGRKNYSEFSKINQNFSDLSCKLYNFDIIKNEWIKLLNSINN